MRAYLSPFSGLLLFFFASTGSAPAILVDWSTQTWPAGSLSNSFDVDPGSPGNDVTVTVSGDTAQLQPSLQPPNSPTPVISTALGGGFSPVHPTLELAIDLANNTQGVTITIDFSLIYATGVADVSFTLFDIDMLNGGGSTYQDEVRSISATSTLGTLIAPTITNLGSSVSLSGSGLTQVLTGIANSAEPAGTGNATITFNATDIRSITFTYGGTALFPNPTYEHIALDNIVYGVVPEIDPTWFTFIFCGILVAWTTLHRRWKKSRSLN